MLKLLITSIFAAFPVFAWAATDQRDLARLDLRPFSQAPSSRTDRIVELERLNHIFHEYGFSAGNKNSGSPISWFNVDQIYYNSELTSAVFVILNTRTAHAELANRLFTLDQDAQLIELSGQGAPPATLIFYRLHSGTIERLLTDIRSETHARNSLGTWLIPEACGDEVAEGGAGSVQQIKNEADGSIKSRLSSCIMTTLSAAKGSTEGMVSSVSAWGNVKEDWAKLKDKFHQYYDFVTQLPHEIPKMLSESGEALHNLAQLPWPSLLNIFCAAIGNMAPQLLAGMVVAGATAKLVATVISRLKTLERFGNLFAMLARLKSMTQAAYLKGSKVIEELVVKSLQGKLSDKVMNTLAKLSQRSGPLAMQYAACVVSS